MKTQTTYSDARAHLVKYMELAASTREPVIIRRRGGEDMALLPAAELESLLETAHLLRSPRNAERLLTALARVREGEPLPALSAEDIAGKVGHGKPGRP